MIKIFIVYGSVAMGNGNKYAWMDKSHATGTNLLFLKRMEMNYGFF